MKVSTSILSSTNRIETIKKLNNSDTDYLHIDTMDGNFVNNKQMDIEEIIEYAKISTKALDIHLMVNNPMEYIDKLSNLNIFNITIHAEIKENIDEILNRIKNLGYNVGLALNPNTDISILDKYHNLIDLVLVMSVEPGKGGQEFITNSVNKAKNIKKLYPSLLIEIDGGINNKTINYIKEAVDISVSGSYIVNSEDFNEAINNLKN